MSVAHIDLLAEPLDSAPRRIALRLGSLIGWAGAGLLAAVPAAAALLLLLRPDLFL
jgi:hypothetical protein